MKIRKDNIESYLLDYLEGSLSEADLQQLQLFLTENPQYVPENGIEELRSLVPDQISYPFKEKLKKEFPDKNTGPVRTNFDFFAIAYLEGDLDPEQRIGFEKFLEEHPELEKNFKLFSKSRLIPEKIIFKGKSSLKKQKTGTSARIWMFLPVAIAASMALLLVIFTNRIKTVALSESGGNKTEIQSLQDQVLADAEIDNHEVVENQMKGAVKEKSVSPELSDRPAKNASQNNSTQPADVKESQVPLNNPENEIIIHQKINIGKMMAANPVIQEFDTEPGSIKPFTYEPYQPYTESKLDLGLARKDVENFVEGIRNEDLSLLNIASHGIEGVNRLAGTDMKLLASKDAEGDVSRFEFTSKRLKITAPLQKSKNSDEN